MARREQISEEYKKFNGQSSTAPVGNHCSQRRDIETLTEEELFAALDSSGYVRLSFRCKTPASLCRGSVNGGNQQSTVRRREGTIEGRKSLRRQRNIDTNIYSTLKRVKKQTKSKSMDTSGGTGRSGALKMAAKTNSSSFDECLNTMPNGSTPTPIPTSSFTPIPAPIATVGGSRLSGSPFDETAEWAEIANIMASFGTGIGRDSSLGNHLNTNGSEDMDNSFTSCISKDSSSTDFEEQSVEDWLARIGLSEYGQLLIVNGFDNVLYM
ncbi:unnamed protein product, partial [Medioppia subpectinata]